MGWGKFHPCPDELLFLHVPGRVGKIRGNVYIYQLSKEKNATIKPRGRDDIINNIECPITTETITTLKQK